MYLHFQNDEDAPCGKGNFCFLNSPMTILWNAWLKVTPPLFEAYLTGTLPAFLVIAAASWAIRREVRIWHKSCG